MSALYSMSLFSTCTSRRCPRSSAQRERGRLRTVTAARLDDSFKFSSCLRPSSSVVESALSLSATLSTQLLASPAMAPTPTSAPSASTEVRVFLITGCSSGFGKAYAQEALKRGHRVVATARKPEVLRDVFEGATDDNFLAVALDVLDKAAIQAAFDAALERFGQIDIVVNKCASPVDQNDRYSAGYGLSGPFEALKDEQVRLRRSDLADRLLDPPSNGRELLRRRRRHPRRDASHARAQQGPGRPNPTNLVDRRALCRTAARFLCVHANTRTD